MSNNGRLLARRTLLLAGLSILALPFSSHAQALTQYETYVSGIANDVIKLANSGSKGQALRQKFNSLLGRYTDVPSVAQFSLGKFRKDLPAERRSEYNKLVLNYISALFVYYVDEFRGSGLEIKGTQTQGKQLIVMSAVKLKKGDTAAVRWRLVPAGSGYVVNDVNIKGIWLSVSMQQRFTDILKKSKGNFDPLFAELRAADTW
jgi:phospholipid transport system substrate-binding protein